MAGSGRSDASIQAFFPPTPNSSPLKKLHPKTSTIGAPIGDGFTAEEVHEALKPQPVEPWKPTAEYAECDIRELRPGARAVTFMGRVANIFDIATTNMQKAPRSAKGFIKLCVKDDTGAMTIRLWYASHSPTLRLGSLVSVWTNHISISETATLSSSSTAPLFASMFPERDRSCHLMAHDNTDDLSLCIFPLSYHEGRPLIGVMALQNFIDGGYDVVDARILVVVKSIGAKKGVTRKDGSVTQNVNLQVHDHTAEATLGLWGTAATSPFGGVVTANSAPNPDVETAGQRWNAGETILLIQAPGWKIGRSTYLSLSSASMIDVNPSIPDTHWLRNWSLRQKSREAINSPFPEGVFDYQAILSGPVRCLYTIADLDDFARDSPTATFQGFLSVVIMDTKLVDCWKRQMLLSGDCCNMAIYANALIATCKGCENNVKLRLNPRILGQVIDETASISTGKLLLSDQAWRDMLGRGVDELLQMGHEQLKTLSDRMLFCRVTLIFGWTGDDGKAGGRICVMGVRP